MTKIGFIGLGIMGKPMALNLINAGYKLTVYDINPEAVKEFISHGAEIAESPRAVAEKNELILLMLPDSPQVKAVVCAENGIITASLTNRLVIDMSSINPLVSKEISALLAEKGCDLLDAPVSGGQEKAEKAALAIMVGGKEEVFEKVKPILTQLGKPVYIGQSGAGQTAKLINQAIVAINIAAVAEALSLAKKSAIDPEKVFQAIRSGLAGSQCLEDKAPRMFSGNYTPGFRIDLHIKDLNNALSAANSLHLSMPLTAQLMTMLQSLAAEGKENLDHGALALFYEKLNNITLSADK